VSEEHADGSVRDFYFSPGWQVLEERVRDNSESADAATTEVRYVWSPVGSDMLILRDRDTDANGTLDERLYVQQDANGNVTSLTTADEGEVVQRFAYDPFGRSTVLADDFTATTDSYEWHYRHQGLYVDPTTGRVYNRARWLDVDLGRFISVDPKGFAAGDVNLRRYVGNGPASGVDPSGMEEKPTFQQLATPKYYWSEFERNVDETRRAFGAVPAATYQQFKGELHGIRSDFLGSNLVNIDKQFSDYEYLRMQSTVRVESTVRGDGTIQIRFMPISAQTLANKYGFTLAQAVEILKSRNYSYNTQFDAGFEQYSPERYRLQSEGSWKPGDFSVDYTAQVQGQRATGFNPDVMLHVKTNFASEVLGADLKIDGDFRLSGPIDGIGLSNFDAKLSGSLFASEYRSFAVDGGFSDTYGYVRTGLVFQDRGLAIGGGAEYNFGVYSNPNLSAFLIANYTVDGVIRLRGDIQVLQSSTNYTLGFFAPFGSNSIFFGQGSGSSTGVGEFRFGFEFFK